MNEPIYCGVENEFQVMNKELEQAIDFRKEMKRLMKNYEKPVFKKSHTSIRTSVGSALYADGAEAEICSSPTRIVKGFSYDATTNLYLARRELAEIVSNDQNIGLIGYSTHWNISNYSPEMEKMRDQTMKYLAIPFGLFTLTPLSVGMNLRNKTNRLELLGDYIHDEDQIRAFFTLYAGMILNFEKNIDSLPFHYNVTPDSDNPRIENPVLDGRYSKVPIKDKKGDLIEITAQEYLEIFYEFFRSGIEEIGSKEDIENLESFILGEKTLEIDRFKKYAFIHSHKRENKELDYHPSFLLDLNYFKEEREVPTALGRFLGSLPHKNFNGDEISPENKDYAVSFLDWSLIDLFDEFDNFYSLCKTSTHDFLGELLEQDNGENSAEIIADITELSSKFDLSLGDYLNGNLEVPSIFNDKYDNLSSLLRTVFDTPIGGLQMKNDFDLSSYLSQRENEKMEVVYDAKNDDSRIVTLEDVKLKFSLRRALSDLTLSSYDISNLIFAGGIFGVFSIFPFMVISSNVPDVQPVERIELEQMIVDSNENTIKGKEDESEKAIGF